MCVCVARRVGIHHTHAHTHKYNSHALPKLVSDSGEFATSLSFLRFQDFIGNNEMIEKCLLENSPLLPSLPYFLPSAIESTIPSLTCLVP